MTDSSTPISRLGVTGTRGRPTTKQLDWLMSTISDFANQYGCLAELHHGACVGADEKSHYISLDCGLNVVIHPPTDQKLMMDLEPWCDDMRVKILPEKPYHDRNRDIVHDTRRLIALPNSAQRPHSGTWYTIDYALGLRRVDICYPDGTTEEHNTELDSDGVRCRHCGVRIVQVELLIGPPQWHHMLRSGEQFLKCHRWPYAAAEPEPWTLVGLSGGEA